MFASVAPLAAQNANDKTLRGTVTIKSSGGAIAIRGTSAAPDAEFLFCVDQDRSVAPRAIDFAGPARVIYRAQPIPGLPEGVKISGPESVANTLAVVADDGRSWVFAAKGQAPLAPDAAAKATAVPTSLVRRLDWSTGKGPRRGTDTAGCLQPAG